MRKYRVVNTLGEGSFASVYKCVFVDPKPGDPGEVAVKHLKQQFKNWEECKRLREVQALTRLKHENIIKCTEVILEPSNELFLVFEYAPRDLWQLITDPDEELGNERIQGLIAQLLNGLAFMHKQGLFHRYTHTE